MESLFRWLAKMLAGILEKYSDPDLQAKLDAFELKLATAEAEAKRLQAKIEETNKEILSLSQKLTENKQKALQLENAISHAKAEAEKKKAELDSLSDGDAVRLDL